MTKKRELDFEARHPGYHLVDWLNDASFDPRYGRVTPHTNDAFTGGPLPSKASRERIRKLVKLVKELSALRSPVYTGQPDDTAERLYWRLWEEFCQAAEDYPGVPSWEKDRDGLGVYAENRGWRRDGEFMAAHCVILLGRTGAIERLRQCICGTWFMARRRDQTSCSGRCRHKRYERTEAFKEHRAIYMRWRYAVREGKAWMRISDRKRPTLAQWKRHEEPTPERWLQILRDR